jgi:hypothetical protein
VSEKLLNCVVIHYSKHELEAYHIMDQQPTMLTLDAVANILKVGIPTVQRLINRGILTAQTHQEQIVISYDDILTFLRDDQRHLLQEEG